MKKIIYIILDGLGDLPLSQLGGKTPLEAAATPHLDRLAQQGITGTACTFSPGIAPESDIAVISLLGYDTNKYYTGRGPLEAFSEGMQIADGNLALRANFATIDKDEKTILDRRVTRSLSTEEAAALAKEINTKVTLKNATFEFKNTIGHRAVLVIRGIRGKLSGCITNPDPAYVREGTFGIAPISFESSVKIAAPMPGCGADPAAIEAAECLNEFIEKSHKVLEGSEINKRRAAAGKQPANIILTRSAGDSLPKFPPVSDIYGMKCGCFVQMPVERGIALLTGMEIVDVPRSTGHLDVDYPVWAKVAIDALKRFDCLYVHIKGPDEPGHDGSCSEKKEVIEAIDAHYFGSLVSKLNREDYIFCVTSDLCTVCEMKAHSALPVPLLISGGSIKPDGSMSFSEKTAKLGSLGEMRAREILPLLVKFASS
ncbi:MAG: alkaline phosphatase family protein [Candidatus Omnitrophica bacterium]|nr:alkaline phosphatase family protein [Candidatus Omnitrophota bacterium]